MSLRRNIDDKNLILALYPYQIQRKSRNICNLRKQLILLKPYFIPTISLPYPYFIPTLSLLNVPKGGSRRQNTGLQVLGLIVVIKFSREFGRYLLYQQLLGRDLAINSLENFSRTIRIKDCKNGIQFLPEAYGVSNRDEETTELGYGRNLVGIMQG